MSMQQQASSPVVSVLCLGAGQDVGRSCVIVSFSLDNSEHNKAAIMFDCGMHMGYPNDQRRFPDFSALDRAGIPRIDLLLITHFHLDHVGALPFYVEKIGYKGPLVMTEPTKRVCPILLEDFYGLVANRVMSSEERDGLKDNFFSLQDIKTTMNKVQCIEWSDPEDQSNLQHALEFAGCLRVRAYPAGHVLGASMFFVEHLPTGASVLYTGDYNTTADRHMSTARCPMKLCPSVLITESTYAGTIRTASKRARERDFLSKVHQAVARGGKVLVPVFALGRVQELCLLVESYWERMGLGKQVPVFFSTGLASKAMDVYRDHGDHPVTYKEQSPALTYNSTEWMSEWIKEMRGLGADPFAFKFIKPFLGMKQSRHLIDTPGPCLMFASPGMLHSGISLELFKMWAGDSKNLLIIPGYCAAGTVGAKVLAGYKTLHFVANKENASTVADSASTNEDIGEAVQVRMQIANLSFSAHADSKGILQVIENCQPKVVFLVHGEKEKMEKLKEQIKGELGIECHAPANGEGIRLRFISRKESEKDNESSKNQTFSHDAIDEMDDLRLLFDKLKRETIEAYYDKFK